MEFLGLGISELFVIVLIALIFVKPEELPSLIKKIVNGIQQFRQISSNVKNDLTRFYEDEVGHHIEDGRQKIRESLAKAEDEISKVADLESESDTPDEKK